jgi:DNA polymerase
MAEKIERPGAQHWVPEGGGVDALREAAAACRGCELWEPATQVVFSAGNPAAPVAMVGEQPGDQEDLRGIPFVGPAGQLLQRAMGEAGLAREDVYVTNAVKHFRFAPRGKRRIHATPEASHVTACKPWLVAELAAVAPRVVVCLGATAVRALLGTQVKVLRDRGTPMVRETSAGTTTFVVTAHPSSVLRVPDDVRDAAYAALVADLGVVARLAAGQPPEAADPAPPASAPAREQLAAQEELPVGGAGA